MTKVEHPELAVFAALSENHEEPEDDTPKKVYPVHPVDPHANYWTVQCNMPGRAKVRVKIQTNLPNALFNMLLASSGEQTDKMLAEFLLEWRGFTDAATHQVITDPIYKNPELLGRIGTDEAGWIKTMVTSTLRICGTVDPDSLGEALTGAMLVSHS